VFSYVTPDGGREAVLLLALKIQAGQDLNRHALGLAEKLTLTGSNGLAVQSSHHGQALGPW
jgi:hypothetical protein